MQLDADLVEWNYGTDEGRPPAVIDQEWPGQSISHGRCLPG